MLHYMLVFGHINLSNWFFCLPFYRVYTQQLSKWILSEWEFFELGISAGV
jgi:hypothetical protein